MSAETMMDDASASEPAAVSHRIQPALIRASAAFSAMRCIRACCAAIAVVAPAGAAAAGAAAVAPAAAAAAAEEAAAAAAAAAVGAAAAGVALLVPAWLSAACVASPSSATKPLENHVQEDLAREPIRGASSAPAAAMLPTCDVAKSSETCPAWLG